LTTEFFNSAESAATYAATAAEILLFVRLAWLGLLREFKIFAFFLIFDAVRTITLLSWDYHSLSYEYIWAVSAPIWTLLLSAVALELSRGLREPFLEETGNRTAALFGFLTGLTVGLLISMVTHPQLIHRPTVLLAVFGNRCMVSGCILGILAQGAYLALGSAPLVANLRLHRRVLLSFMTAIVVASFGASSKQRELAEWVFLLRSVTLLGCFCVWIGGFRRMFCDLWDIKGKPTDAQLADIIVYNRRRQMAVGVRTAVDRPSTT
jgi:hypothetical protein